MHCLRLTTVAAGTVLLLAAAGAPAQTARSGGGGNAQMLQQMQQLASERTTLQAENEKLKSELAEVKKDRDALKAGQQTLDKRSKEAVAAIAHVNAQRDASEQEVTQTRAKMQELIGKFRETVQKMREIETGAATTRQTLATREHDLSVCVDHNQALYKLNGEILTHMDKEGPFTRVAQAEPFTKIKRIQLENLIDDYHARAQDQLVPAAPAPAPASPAAPAAAEPKAP
ncbi:MAG: hypothetical protein JSS29_12195 [Proteobacteria bacterium]|nr:hypothetical protein [Pseudomonadota bacterium]